MSMTSENRSMSLAAVMPEHTVITRPRVNYSERI